MDRLQKKCLIVTTAMHGLLVLVVLFGSALMPSQTEENNAKLFTLYDVSKIVDDLPSGGGNPDVKLPAQQPKPPEPAPPQPQPPKPEVKPEPPAPKPTPPQRVETPKPREVVEDKPKLVEKMHEPKSKLTPDELTPIETKPTKSMQHHPAINKDELRSYTRHTKQNSQSTQQDNSDAAADRAARRKAAREFASALRSLGKNLSTKTLVDMTPGPGGAGEIAVNYRDLIASKYYNAWVAPVGLEDDTPVVTASVTISRSGDVINTRIIKRSGNPLMDRSIERVLETVTFIEPFPESSHEQERTVTIQFNLQAKRQIG